jgi:predicted outer membrane repeat protein
MNKRIGLMVLGVLLGLVIHGYAGGYSKGGQGVWGGVVYASDGTAAAPGVSYLSDKTTGMYLYGDGTNGFSALTVPVWYYDTNGITLLNGLVYTGNGSGLTNLTVTDSALDNRTATNNVNMGGYSVTNGSFAGNGASLTNIPYAGLSFTDWTGTLDGYDGSAFGRLAANQTWTGTNTVSGELRAGVQTGTYAASATNTAAQMRGGVIYVTGAATITLPAVNAGDSVTIITIGAVAVSVDPNGSDKIWLDGVALDDGDKITNTSTAGDLAVITYYSADGWHAASNGWTDGG